MTDYTWGVDGYDRLNQRTLLEAKLELKALQERRPKTPEEHRDISNRIVYTGQVIELIEREERITAMITTADFDVEILPARGGIKTLCVNAVYKDGAKLEVGQIKRTGRTLSYNDKRFGDFNLGPASELSVIKQKIKGFINRCRLAEKRMGS